MPVQKMHLTSYLFLLTSNIFSLPAGPYVTDDDGWCYLDFVNPDETYFQVLDQEDHLKALTQLVHKGLQHSDEKVREKYPWLLQKIAEARNSY